MNEVAELESKNLHPFLSSASQKRFSLSCSSCQSHRAYSGECRGIGNRIIGRIKIDKGTSFDVFEKVFKINIQKCNVICIKVIADSTKNYFIYDFRIFITPKGYIKLTLAFTLKSPL